jgi:hypothetical protein
MANLDSFLGTPKASTTTQQVASEPQTVSEPTQSEPEAPKGVVEITLPSGIEVYFQAAPKRLYRLRASEDEEWIEVPSMSEVTKILDKPGLVHWGEKVGINMVQVALREGWYDADFAKKTVGEPGDWFTGKHLQEIGKTKRLTNYYMKDSAASRGTSVHKALEYWATSGEMPNPADYDEIESGYVQGVVNFLKDSGVIPMMSEVMVGSINHRVAGRFDLLGNVPQDVEVYRHITEKGRGDKKSTLQSGTRIFDLKTSKGIYEDHMLQVTGYNGILKESGYPEAENVPSLVRVTDDGRYCVVDSLANWEDFWFARGLYDGIQRMKGKA